MSEARIKISSTGANQLIRKLDRIDDEMRRIGKSTRKTSQQMKRGFGALSAPIGKLGAVLGGVGVAAKGKEILDFNRSLGVLQVKMGLTNREAFEMRDRLLNVATATGKTKEELLGAVETLQDQGGVVKEGMPGLEKLAKLSAALGVPLKDLTSIQSKLIARGFTTKEQLETIATLAKQADMANIAISDLARVMPQALGAMEVGGFGGAEAAAQAGGVLQAIGEVQPSAEEARTVVRALIRDISRGMDPEKGNKGMKKYLKGAKGLKEILDRLSKASTSQQRLFGFTEQGLEGLAGVKTLKGKGQFDMVIGAKGTEKEIDDRFKVFSEGVAKESLKVSQTMTKLDSIAQKYGTTLIKFMSDSPVAALATGAVGYAGFRVLGAAIRGGVQKVFVLNQSPVGGGFGQGMGLMGKLGILGAVGGAAYALASFADEALGISESIADFAVDISGQREKMRLSLESGRKVQQKRAVEGSVSQFVDMAKRKVKIQGKGGERIELTPEKIAEIVAKQQNVTDPEMLKTLKQLVEKKFSVEIHPGTGLAKPEAMQKKGKQ